MMLEEDPNSPVYPVYHITACCTRAGSRACGTTFCRPVVSKLHVLLRVFNLVFINNCTLDNDSLHRGKPIPSDLFFSPYMALYICVPCM